MVVDSNRVSDGFISLEGGMNSGRHPYDLPINQAALLVNCSVRGGRITHRPGWKRWELNWDNVTEPLKSARFQGATGYLPMMGEPALVFSLAGRTYRINPGSWMVTEITIPNEPDWGMAPQVWFCQSNEFLVKQDGFNRPWIYNGAQARRATIFEIPGGTITEYAMGRIWVVLNDRRSFVAGDLVNGPSGTPGNNFRDSVLKMEENSFLAEGGTFAVPIEAGPINAVRALTILDTSLGQGPIQFFTTNGGFSVNAPFDRTLWQLVEYPIQTVSLGSPGALSQYSTIAINSDLWFRSATGIQSFVQARRDFGGWANVPMSSEVQRILEHDTSWMLDRSSAVFFDNRLLMTAQPRQTSRGVHHCGLIVLDYHLISSLANRLPPAYEGLWSGLDIHQLVTTQSRSGQTRCWAFVRGADGIELWEMLPQSTLDDYGGIDLRRIQWMIETKAYDYGQMGDVKLATADLAIDDIQGRFEVSAYFRNDRSPCWELWKEFDQCAKTGICEGDEDCLGTLMPRRSYNPNITLPQPPDVCDAAGIPKRHGRRHQVKLNLIGTARLLEFVINAHKDQEDIFRACPPAEATCVDERCCEEELCLTSIADNASAGTAVTPGGGGPVGTDSGQPGGDGGGGAADDPSNMPKIGEQDLECTTGELATFYSSYYWGLNPDQNPNVQLTLEQIECSIGLLEAEFAEEVESLGRSVVGQSSYFWQFDTGVQNEKFAFHKWNAGNCTPTGDGEPPPFFDGFGWTLGVKYCWESSE